MNRRRKIRYRMISGVLTCALVLSAAPLSRQAEAAKKPKLSKTSVKLYVGKKVTLKVKNYKKKVKWSSNKKKIATVSKKGVVKAKKAGTVKITAKAGKKKLTCKVKVLAKKTTTKTTPKPNTPVAPNTNATQKPDIGNIPEETTTGNVTSTAIPWNTPKPSSGVTSTDIPWNKPTDTPEGSSHPEQTASHDTWTKTPAVSATPAPTLPTEDTGLTEEQQQEYQQTALNGVNGKRADAGLPDLVIDESLNYVAYLLAKEYVAQYWLSDDTKQSALASTGVDYEAYSISIDCWKNTYDDVLNHWMDSEESRDTILSESYNKTGIAVVNNGQTNFWVQVFVKDTSGSNPTPSPGPLPTPIVTGTPSPTATVVPAPSPSTTATSNPTAPPSPATPTPKVTTTPMPATPAPVVTPKVTPTPIVTPKVTPTPIVTPKVTPTPIVTPKVTPTPVVTPKVTPTPVVTPKVTPTPVVTPKVTPTPTPKITPTPTPKVTPAPTPLTNPAKITLNGSGQSWNTFQTSDSKVSVTGSASVTISCTGISNAEIWYVCIPQLLQQNAFTSQEGLPQNSSIWASGGTCANGGTVSVPNMGSAVYVYVRVHDKSTGFIYYLSSAGIEVSAATPTSAPTATPTLKPTATPSTGTGTAGTNVNLSGKTAFTVGSYQLAIGLTKAEVNTVLGSLSVDVKREEKSPQGFDVIAFRPNGNDSTADYDDKFSTYILIYLKNNVVVGITAIAPTVNYGNVISVGTSESTLRSNGWSAVDWYQATNAGTAAYTKNVNGTNVIGFIDYYGNKNVYCIQAFSSDYSVDDMTNPSKTTCTLGYSDAVNTAMATEIGELLNAYLVMNADRGALRINTKLSGVAVTYSNTIAGNGATDAKEVSRSSALVKSAMNAAGITSSAWGEHILIGNIDAIGFVNSLIESSEGRTRLHNSDYTLMGLGVNASSSGGTYYPNLVIDFTAFISTM